MYTAGIKACIVELFLESLSKETDFILIFIKNNNRVNLYRMKTLFKPMLLTLLIGFSLNSFSQQGVTQANLSPQEKEWFVEKSWLQGADASYDPSLDVATFVKHYQEHPARWNKAFRFIRDNDLTSLPLGKQTLGDDVTVTVQEYTTKEPGKELLEGHKDYIDLQYIVSGLELQGYAKIEEANDTVKPYSASEDIALYTVPTITYHAIKPNHFTIFFPDDIHTTNIQYGEKAPVRKVVFKIKVN